MTGLKSARWRVSCLSRQQRYKRRARLTQIQNEDNKLNSSSTFKVGHTDTDTHTHTHTHIHTFSSSEAGRVPSQSVFEWMYISEL
jgi:hypothetical protein